ncbi:MAG: PucR family transcriptional regulator ligand-binding domain-containing protein, partial [Bacillota bacterium]
MLTVRRALKIGGLAKACCVAGEQGLDRVIKYVDIMEVPDAVGWIRPSEILITCAYSIKDDPAAQVNLIRSLSRCNAAALAVKPCRFLGPMPRVMIDAANEEGLPLIEIPAGLSYIEITHPLLAEILNDEVHELQYEADVHRKMTRLVLDQKGLESVAATLSGLLGSGVYILDDGFQVLAKSGVEGRNEDPSDRSQSVAALARSMMSHAPGQALGERNGIISGRGISCSPIRSGGNPLGFLVMDVARRGPFTTFEVRAIEQATIASGLEIAKMIAIRETQARLRSDFFARVLSGQDETQAVTMAKILGIDMECPYAVVVAAI